MVDVNSALAPSAGVTGYQIFVNGQPPQPAPPQWQLQSGSYPYTVMMMGAPGDQVAFTITGPNGQLAAGTLVVSAGHTSSAGTGSLTV